MSGCGSNLRVAMCNRRGSRGVFSMRAISSRSDTDEIFATTTVPARAEFVATTTGGEVLAELLRKLVGASRCGLPWRANYHLRNQSLRNLVRAILERFVDQMLKRLLV